MIQRAAHCVGLLSRLPVRVGSTTSCPGRLAPVSQLVTTGMRAHSSTSPAPPTVSGSAPPTTPAPVPATAGRRLTAGPGPSAAAGHQRAASAIVLSPRRVDPLLPAGSPPSAWDVLVLQRSATGTFQNALVFPGGKLDPADEETAAELLRLDALAHRHQLHQHGQANNGSPLGPDARVSQQQLALRVAALRETFEETGLLLVPSLSSNSQHGTGRRQSQDPGLPLLFRALVPAEWGYDTTSWATVVEDVHAHPHKFVALLLRAATSTPAAPSAAPASASALTDDTAKPVHVHAHADDASRLVDALMHAVPEYTRWWAPIAPAALGGGPRRKFDTSFYILPLETPVLTGPPALAPHAAPGPEQEAAVARPDGGELTAVHLESAGEVVRRALRGEATLYPPQMYMLSDLASSESRELHDRASPVPGSPPRQKGEMQGPAALPAPHAVPMVPLIVPGRADCAGPGASASSLSPTSSKGQNKLSSAHLMLLPSDTEYAQHAHAHTGPAGELARMAAAWAAQAGSSMSTHQAGPQPTHRLQVTASKAAGFTPISVERVGVPGARDLRIDGSAGGGGAGMGTRRGDDLDGVHESARIEPGPEAQTRPRSGHGGASRL